jgi:RNA polymerase sigma-70 factor, ECF subfamily
MFMKRDDEEFAEIFNEVYPKLCRFLECLAGSRSLAQDIAQESFLRLYHTGVGVVPFGEARFWLFRVARNLALNELDKSRRRAGLFQKVQEAFRGRPKDPEAELLLKEDQREIVELLGTLSEPQRVALLLREQEEMSYLEIARVLNISESKVKVDIFRARSRLRDRWRQSRTALRSESVK